jgi:hypothetical protein
LLEQNQMPLWNLAVSSADQHPQQRQFDMLR